MFDLKSIFKSVRKLFTFKDIAIVIVLSLLFFATRLINLDKFPIFNDEGIYIHWAKVAWHDSSWRFISLTDGKQPLQTWGTIPFLKLFSTNMVLGGRLFAVSTGFFALIGLFILLYYLFGKKAAFWGALFYILTPYFIFYDRMALVDSGVNAFFIWIFLFSILLVQNLDLATALLFGLIGGIGLLAKSSVRIFVALAAFAPILAYQKHKKSLMWFIIISHMKADLEF
jgi:4-amino-4-deoxy-L-arabinose transferase-like glycosyltransferase